MVLTIGTKVYRDNLGLEALVHMLKYDKEYQACLAKKTANLSKDDYEKFLRQACEKIKTWVKRKPKYTYGAFFCGIKGQDKSFATVQGFVDALWYKTTKPYRDNRNKERNAATVINDNAGIRETTYKLKEKLCEYIAKKIEEERKANARDAADAAKVLGAFFLKQKYTKDAKVARKNNQETLKEILEKETGRYAYFYSKLGFKRNLYEGYQYFRKKTKGTISRSEFAAYIADVAIIAQRRTRIHPQHMSFDLLRVNAAEVNQYADWIIESFISDAIEKRINKISVAVYGDQVQAAVAALRNALGEIKRELSKEYQLGEKPDAAKQLWLAIKEVEVQLLNKYVDVGAVVTSVKESLVQRVQKTFQPKLLNALTDLEKLEICKKDDEKTYTPLKHNVASEHEWTKFMMRKNMLIGAGPSATTTCVLYLLKEWGLATNDLEYFHGMCILFAFWQRKRKKLKGESAIHTWNEVCMAYHKFMSDLRVVARKQGQPLLKVSNDDADQPDYHFFACPSLFDNAGFPTYPDLLGGYDDF